MKVCFFGSYVKSSNDIPSGNGGILLRKILESQNVQVVECHEPMEKISDCFRAYWKLFCKHRKINYDILIIPWRGILTLPLAKLIHRKPIVYFPAFSIYDTLVNDRKKFSKNSLKAKIIHFIDKTACRWANLVILESTAEIDYFVNEFNSPKDKFCQLWLSVYEPLFPCLPFKSQTEEFTVLYFGEFIPLHGVDTIVKTAKILRDRKDIKFILCGHGQTLPEIQKFVENYGLTNVRLLGMVSVDTLLENIKNSDICFGIFGTSEKSKKVLTNKTYQILASRKPLLTMESPTSKEAGLENKKNCILIQPSSFEELAKGIIFLKENEQVRKQIAENGYQTYVENMSLDKVGKKLVKICQRLNSN